MSAPTIALARPDDLAAIPGIERAAAALLRGHAPESVLEETTSAETARGLDPAARIVMRWGPARR